MDTKGGDDSSSAPPTGCTAVPVLTILAGGPGFDVVYAGGGKDRIDRGSRIDTIYGGSGFDTINSTDLADRIVDTVGGYELLVAPPASSAHAAPVTTDDAVYAAASETVDIAVLDNDHDPNENRAVGSLTITMAPTWGTASVAGSSSRDVVVRYIADSVDGADNFTYQVCDTLNTCSTAQVTVTVGTSHCTIVGTHGGDTLRGTLGSDIICGLGGDDTILGLGSGDVIIGGAGNDTLYGDDALFGGPGDDTLYGGNGDDTLWGPGRRHPRRQPTRRLPDRRSW